MSTKHKSSYMMLIFSMLIFGTIGIFRKYIPISSALLAFLRGILGSLIIVVFLCIKKRITKNKLGRKNLILLIFTGSLIGINWILLFEAYNYTSVAVATLCYYMQPTIVIVLAPIFFREKLTPKKSMCAFISIIGMILVSGLAGTNYIQASDIKGITFGLLAATLYASVIILNKLISVDDAYEKTLIQLLSAAIVLVPYILFTEDFSKISLDTTSILLILIVGIVHTGFAYVLYFASMGQLSSQSIALLSYLDPVFALILSALVLHENLSVYGLIGALLIIGSAIISELKTN